MIIPFTLLLNLKIQILFVVINFDSSCFEKKLVKIKHHM